MNFVTYFGALLLAVLALALPAVVHKQHWVVIREGWRKPLRLALMVLESELGAVVVTYCNPQFGAPSTTPLTAAQAAHVPLQAAQILWSDGDTQAIFVHNWGLDPSAPTYLRPIPLPPVNVNAAANSFATNFTFGLANTNQVYITKVNVGTGSGGTYNVYLLRPDGPYLRVGGGGGAN
jgi:hypothetical protein